MKLHIWESQELCQGGREVAKKKTIIPIYLLLKWFLPATGTVNGIMWFHSEFKNLSDQPFVFRLFIFERGWCFPGLLMPQTGCVYYILLPSIFIWALFAASSYNVSLRQGTDGFMFSSSVSESRGIVSGKKTYQQGSQWCFCFFLHSCIKEISGGVSALVEGGLGFPPSVYWCTVGILSEFGGSSGF